VWPPPPKKKAQCNADAYYLNACGPIREIVKNARALEPTQWGYASPTHAIVVQRYVYIFQPMGTDPRGLLNIYRRNI